MQAIEYLFNFHIYFINILNSRINFARWILSVFGIVFRDLLWFDFHRIFDIGKLFHEITILFAIITESRNGLIILPFFFIQIDLFKGGNLTVWWWILISFDSIRCNWVPESIPIRRIRIVGLSLCNVLSRSVVCPKIRLVLAMRWSVILPFYFLYSHIRPGIPWLFTGRIIRLWWWLILALELAHCDLRYFIEAVLSLHFINKNITS